MSRLQKMIWAAERPVVLLGGSRWSEAALRRRCSASPSASRCRSPPRSAARICSIPSIPATPAISASAPIRSCWRASRTPTSSSWSAGGSARCRRRAIRCSTFPAPKQTLVHVFPGVEELGRVYRAAACDQCRADRLRGRARRPAAAERPALGGRHARRACGFPRLDR